MNTNDTPQSAEFALSNSTDVAIIRSENIAAIVNEGPESYRLNRQSTYNCLSACEQLIAKIETDGMTDELDSLAAKYIERTRRTIQDMNKRRAPLTKIFDQIRAEFTALENAIDPKRKNTAPAKLQELRNAYAAELRRAAEARRLAEETERLVRQAKAEYRAAIIADDRAAFNRLLTTTLNELNAINTALSVENYDATADTIRGFHAQLPLHWNATPSVLQPCNLSPEESSQIREQCRQETYPVLAEDFRSQIESHRDEILDRLPSKLTELQRAAKASEAEAARIKAEIAAAETAEAAQKEQERIEKERVALQQAAVAASGSQLQGLFDQARIQAEYTPKTTVAKKISISAPAAFLQIFSLWWSHEGCKLSVEELSQILKKQLSFCEKLATKEQILISDPDIEYFDDIKAR